MRGRSVKEVDVVVVGAGPIGGYFARRMAELNCTVLILEEHLEIGKPFQCAGLVNPAAMERVDLYDTILSEIDGSSSTIFAESPLWASIRKSNFFDCNMVLSAVVFFFIMFLFF